VIKKALMTMGAVASFFLISMVIIFVGYEGLLFYAHDMNPNYALIDRCLDLGRQWDYNENICKE
jgi:hypothetical protein